MFCTDYSNQSVRELNWSKLHALQQKHSGCQTPPMQLRNLPCPISAWQPTHILQENKQRNKIDSLELM